MAQVSTECKTLVQRLKGWNYDEVCRNPSSMLKYYPIRDPDKEATIFDEVYPLINEALLTKTYRSRVLYFLNTLLSSTKIPAYVIATYIKRLSRLTLVAKPKTLVLILHIIGNLFLRHPTLTFLRDKVDDQARELELKSTVCTLRQWLDNDPFQADQTSDLMATGAMDSCVWELLPLRYHRHPKVAAAASYLSQTPMLEMEFDLEDLIK